MNIDLSEKTAIVTGSTAGIGYAIAKGLLHAGAEVIVNGRSGAGVEHAVASLAVESGRTRVRGIVADVGTAEGCAALVQAVPVADILINNVGVYGPQDFFETPDAVWERFFEINVMSGVRLSRAYLSGMAERQWGRVVFVSSESALNIPADMIHYGFTKTANLSVSRGLAKRMAGTGVTVNAVLPGPTLTEGVEAMLRDVQKRSGLSMTETAAAFVAEQRPSSLIRRAATPEEVANLVVYIVSPQASATTGAALRVDGGVVESIA